MLDIEFPVIAFSHCRDVVAAVSRTGGLGVLGATAFSAQQLERELTWIEEHTGGRPYGVDVLVPSKYVGQSEGGLDRTSLAARIPEEHRRFVADLLDRYGVPPLSDDRIHRNALDENISARGASNLLDVVFGHPRVGLLANALGPPPARMVDEARARGIPVAALVGTVAHALRQRDAGVDLIVAQGYEAGGHTGEIATMVLVPEVIAAVDPVPVLAAGGIATGRQMAAAITAHAPAAGAGRRRPPSHLPGVDDPGFRGRGAGHLLRGPGRRVPDHGAAGRPGAPRHGRGVGGGDDQPVRGAGRRTVGVRRTGRSPTRPNYCLVVDQT
jgi:hypothetical protein